MKMLNFDWSDFLNEKTNGGVLVVCTDNFQIYLLSEVLVVHMSTHISLKIRRLGPDPTPYFFQGEFSLLLKNKNQLPYNLNLG